MNKKSLIILCAIFIILISLVVAKKSMRSNIPLTEETADVIAQPVKAEDFSGILLRIGEGKTEDEEKPQTVHMAKKAGRWVVETQYGVNANEKALTPVFEKLDQLKGELRSDRGGILGDYGISDEEGVHVELRREDGKGIHVVVGTKQPSYQENFVRLGGANAVYIVNENLLGTLGVRGEGEERKLDDKKWADKRIVDIDADKVAAFAVTRVVGDAEATDLDIRKQTTDGVKKWQSVQPYAFNLNASKIKSMLERFNNTYAREIIAPKDGAVYDASGWVGTFTMEDGAQVKLVRGTKDESGDNYFVRREGAGYDYLVPVSTFDGREKSQGNILANNPLRVEEGTVEEIEIQDKDSKKEFRAVKIPAAPMSTENGEETKTEDAWQAPDGTTIEKSKVNDIVNKLKNMNLDVLPPSVPRAKALLTVRIAREGETLAYTISEALTLGNGQECHLLSPEGDTMAYCATKAQINALKDALP